MNELEYGRDYYERGVISPEEFIDMYLQPEVKDLQQQNAEYRRLIKEACEVIDNHSVDRKWRFLNRPEVEQILEGE